MRSPRCHFIPAQPIMRFTEQIEQSRSLISAGPGHPLQTGVFSMRIILVTLSILIGVPAGMMSAAQTTGQPAMKHATPAADQQPTRDIDQPVEVGDVQWSRDLDGACKESEQKW